MENTIGNKLYNDVLKNHKRELEAFDKQKREIHRLWNIDAETAKYLFEYIVDLAPKKIIEIGTSNGYSGFWISAAAKVSNGILETIEVDEERFKLSQNNLKNQTNIIPTLENKYDIAFIDAGKIGYINYIKLLLPKLKDNAIIIADNVISHKKSVQEYIDFMKSDNQFENELIEIGTGLLISKFKRNRV